MTYEDFVIHIGPRLGDGFQVRVSGSPAGDEASGILRLQEPREEHCRVLGGRSREIGAGESSRVETRAARDIGGALFRSLFTGKIRDRFVTRLGDLRQERGKGLRIRIRLDPQDPDFDFLNAQPWELLDGAATGEPPFLGLSRSTPIVRYLEVGQSVHPQTLLPSRLRILLVGASPIDQPPLDLAREAAGLAKAWKVKRVAEIVPLERADLKLLRETLLDGGFHVLHFMGHGGFNQSTGEGLLSFEGEDGHSRLATAEDVAMELRDCKSLRVIFLNACKTATLAPDLLSTGVPAVLAMQCPVSDKAAIAFSGAFYRRLAAGDAIESAVTEGRLAVRRIDKRVFEWAIPVLFLRAADGELFESSKEEENWSLPGVAMLTGGVLGFAALAGLLYLLAWDRTFLRDTLTAVFAVLTTLLGGLGWWKEREGPGLAQRLSQLAAKLRPLQAACALLVLTALAGWSTIGSDKVCDLQCEPLGCPKRGIKRVLIEPLQEASTEDEEAGNILRDKMSLIGSLQVIGQARIPEKARRCVDFRVRLTRSGDTRATTATLTAVVVTPDGVQAPPVEGSGESRLEALNDLAFKLLKELDVEIGPDLRQKLLETPTANPMALQLNNEGIAEISIDPEKAEAKLLMALELDPSYSSVQNNLGMLELQRGSYSAAIDWFSQAIGNLPLNPTYHYNLGLAQDLQGNRPAAIAAYREALSLDPAFAQAHNSLGFVLLETGKLGEAGESFRRALALALDEDLEAVVYKNLGRLALAQGKAKEARRYLGQALDRHQDYAEALFYLAITEEETGERSAACATWKRYGALSDHKDESQRQAQAQRRTLLACQGSL